MSHDILVLPVEGLDLVASPAALEAALVRTAGVESVSMNVAAGRVRIVFDPARLRLGDLAAIVCGAGCGLCVSETVVRVRTLDYPWRCASVVQMLRELAGVVDAEWDRETDFVIVSYLPSRIRSAELLDAIVKAGYRLARDAVMVSEVPAVYTVSGRRAAMRERTGALTLR